MGNRECEIIRTLYAERDGYPLRIELTRAMFNRIRILQRSLRTSHLRANEDGSIEVHLRNGTIMVGKNFIDIGIRGYEGWDSYIPEQTLRRIEDLPKVYFSMMFLYHLNKNLYPDRREAYMKVLRPKHKELLVWKKIEGTA